jgi:proteasome beta subunit
MIKGVLEHENLWGSSPLGERSEEEATSLSIRLLQTAAQFDSATGQARPEDKLYPIIAKITKDGYQFISDDHMESIYESSMSRS